MIRVKPCLPKLKKSTLKHKSVHSFDCQNDQQVVFNTRGYFDPCQPFDQQYFKAKEKVFLKYRNKDQQYVMINAKDTTKSSFIQRGCLTAIQEINECDEKICSQKARISLLKKYLIRKEKREQLDQERYTDPPKINAEILHPKMITTPRLRTRQVLSRDSFTSHLKSQFQL